MFNRKRYISALRLWLASLLLSPGTGAGAQTPSTACLRFDGQLLRVSWTEATAARTGSEYCKWLTPMLCGAHDTLRLQPVSVRGRLSRKRLERAAALNRQAAPATYGELKPGDTIQYQASIDCQPWMQHGAIDLCIAAEQEGCCQVETLPKRQVAQTVYVPEFQPCLTPVPENRGKGGELATHYPLIVHTDSYRPYHPDSAIGNARGAMWIHFPLNRYDVRRNFRHNKARLDELEELTRLIMADAMSGIQLIQVVGKASPEGPRKHNTRLAGRRAQALKCYLQQRVEVPDSLFEVINGGEAWAELRAEIAQSHCAYRQEMLDIIDHTPDPDQRERRLKQLHGGKAYRLLRREMLPQQRYSGYYRVYYSHRPDTVPPIINRSISLIQQGRHAEALQLVRTVSHDSRSYNTLATALYLCGQTGEAYAYYRKAQLQHDTDATRNMQQIQHIATQQQYQYEMRQHKGNY